MASNKLNDVLDPDQNAGRRLYRSSIYVDPNKGRRGLNPEHFHGLFSKHLLAFPQIGGSFEIHNLSAFIMLSNSITTSSIIFAS